ncbi:hypothetical protein [Aeromonas phage 85AhydR10PP]|nr:hypothetical protein [Aeromonas phage 85AhydR10PP]
MGIQANRHTRYTGVDFSHFKDKDKQGPSIGIRAAREPYREQDKGKAKDRDSGW